MYSGLLKISGTARSPCTLGRIPNTKKIKNQEKSNIFNENGRCQSGITERQWV
jgi:hypothetical protein